MIRFFSAYATRSRRRSKLEIVRDRNFAPNNTLILIWDFGMPISLVALLFSTGSI